MKQYIDVRGHRIAVNTVSGAQLRWYRHNYALRSDIVLAGLAAQTAIDDALSVSNCGRMAREIAARARRAQFHIV